MDVIVVNVPQYSLSLTAEEATWLKNYIKDPKDPTEKQDSIDRRTKLYDLLGNLGA